MKPVLLVDVDGVLNPWRMSHKNRVKGEFTVHDIEVDAPGHDYGRYDVLLSPQHTALFEELADSFELVWATTWNELANKLLVPLLGMPELPVLKLDPGRVSSARKLCWKTMQVVAAFTEGGTYEGRHFAWLDDDTTKRDRTFLNHLFGDGFHKLVLVDPAQGFTREQAERLKVWAEGLN